MRSRVLGRGRLKPAEQFAVEMRESSRLPVVAAQAELQEHPRRRRKRGLAREHPHCLTPRSPA